MIGNKTVLVTICARGGSKGIPGKNLKILGGKPLLDWTLVLLPQIKYWDRAILSSDSIEILERGRRFLQQSFNLHQRPPELATDTISRVEAIKEAVIFAEILGKTQYDIIVDVGVATPFKTAGDVNACIEMLKENEHITTGFVGNHNPYFDMMEENIRYGGYSLCLTTSSPITARQLAPKVITLNDAVNVWSRECLFHPRLEYRHLLLMDIHEMPPVRSIHLDTPLDWALAECVLEKKLLSS